MSLKAKMLVVIDYLNGKTDIYDGKHGDIVNAWNDAWDEMKWMGYNPETAGGIKKYINEQL